jgi:hypothetical protein
MFIGMGEITFLDKSHAGAAALRASMEAKFSDRFWQIAYADTDLRQSLIRQELLSRKSNQLDLVPEAQPLVQGLGRSVSLDDFVRRQVKFDPDTEDRVRRLLDGELPDEDLPALSKKIGDIIDQISVSSPRRNALIALLNYIDAQGSIALGYAEDVSDPKTPDGKRILGIGFELWSVPSSGSSTWGSVFPERAQYVSSQGGDITFILPEGEKGHTFTAQGAYASYRIWKEILRQIDTMPELDYKPILSVIIEDDILSKINDSKDLRMIYAHHIFCQVYGASNEPSSPIASTPIDRPTIDLHVERAIKALKDGKVSNSNQRGAMSYFELAYLLEAGHKFRIVGSEEKIQSFVDFSTDESDPDEQEFRSRFRALMAEST